MTLHPSKYFTWVRLNNEARNRDWTFCEKRLQRMLVFWTRQPLHQCPAHRHQPNPHSGPISISQPCDEEADGSVSLSVLVEGLALMQAQIVGNDAWSVG